MKFSLFSILVCLSIVLVHQQSYSGPREVDVCDSVVPVFGINSFDPLQNAVEIDNAKYVIKNNEMKKALEKQGYKLSTSYDNGVSELTVSVGPITTTQTLVRSGGSLHNTVFTKSKNSKKLLGKPETIRSAVGGYEQTYVYGSKGFNCKLQRKIVNGVVKYDENICNAISEEINKINASEFKMCTNLLASVAEKIHQGVKEIKRFPESNYAYVAPKIDGVLAFVGACQGKDYEKEFDFDEGSGCEACKNAVENYKLSAAYNYHMDMYMGIAKEVPNTEAKTSTPEGTK